MPGCLKEASLFHGFRTSISNWSFCVLFFCLSTLLRYYKPDSWILKCIPFYCILVLDLHFWRNICLYFPGFFFVCKISESRSSLLSLKLQLHTCGSMFLFCVRFCVLIVHFLSLFRPFVLQPQSYEAVEPLDLEEFLMSQLKSGDVTLMQELGEFPDDDLKVEQIEKECRTVKHSVPNDAWVTLHRASCYLTNSVTNIDK